MIRPTTNKGAPVSVSSGPEGPISAAINIIGSEAAVPLVATWGVNELMLRSSGKKWPQGCG